MRNSSPGVDSAQLQIALDNPPLSAALAAAREVADIVDIFEVGTILAAAEGVHAVRVLHAEFPSHVVVADIRIVRAGRALAELAFEAGATWVSVMESAPDETIAAAVVVAHAYGGEIQAELEDHTTQSGYDRLVGLGVTQAIVHRSHEANSDVARWTAADFDRIRCAAAAGLKVTVTGGVTASDFPYFVGVPVSVFIVGRAITQAADPHAAAATLQQAIRGNVIG